MKNLITLIFICIYSLTFGQEKPETTSIVNVTGEKHIAIAGTKVSLIPPYGFDNAENFNGLKNAASSSSIMVLEIPGPYAETSRDFTKEELITKGISLLNKEDLSVNGLSGTFIKTEQTAYGTLYIKYILAFGTDSNTVMITGMFPKDYEELMESEVKNSLFSVVYSPERVIDPLENLKFGIDVSGTKFKLANVMANAILYTVDGKVPTASEDKATVIVAGSLSRIQVDDKKEYAISKVNISSSYTNIELDSVNEITVAGIEGYEILARGTSAKTGENEMIYEVMLFYDSLYYLFYGIAPDKREENLEIFKKVSRTFALKNTY